MRRLLFATCLLASCATAQATWRGKIVDCKTTAPISDADVQLTVGANEGAASGTTGSDGSFSFSPAGAQKTSTAAITVTHRGYQVTQATLGPPGSADPVCMSPTR